MKRCMVALMLSIALMGCYSEETHGYEELEEVPESVRLKTEVPDWLLNDYQHLSNNVYVYTDPKTGVEYLVDRNVGGMTVRLNVDGTVRVHKQ